MHKFSLAVLAAAMAVTPILAIQSADAATRPKHGCFKVVTPALNLRDGPYSSSKAIAVVSNGDILIKRRAWCTLRGFWCAVATEDGIKGYVDKNFIEIAPCPARLAR